MDPDEIALWLAQRCAEVGITTRRVPWSSGADAEVSLVGLDHHFQVGEDYVILHKEDRDLRTQELRALETVFVVELRLGKEQMMQMLTDKLSALGKHHN